MKNMNKHPLRHFYFLSIYIFYVKLYIRLLYIFIITRSINFKIVGINIDISKIEQEHNTHYLTEKRSDPNRVFHRKQRKKNGKTIYQR